MSDPRKKYVGCPLCNQLLEVWRGNEEAQCPTCDSILDPRDGSLIERRKTKARKTITQRPLR